MASSIVEKLMNSFDELDRCITVTHEVLRDKPGITPDVLSRVEQYNLIVSKQRALAEELEACIVSENWDEVSRLVKLINGLSAMIRDDAQAILNNVASPLTQKAGGERDEKLC